MVRPPATSDSAFTLTRVHSIADIDLGAILWLLFGSIYFYAAAGFAGNPCRQVIERCDLKQLQYQLVRITFWFAKSATKLTGILFKISSCFAIHFFIRSLTRFDSILAILANESQQIWICLHVQPWHVAVQRRPSKAEMRRL